MVTKIRRSKLSTDQSPQLYTPHSERRIFGTKNFVLKHRALNQRNFCVTKTKAETIQLPPQYFKRPQDLIFILGLIFFLGLQYSYLSELHQLPSPLYGGDQYFHYGHVLHLSNGGSVFESSHYLGEYEHYPWLTHLVIAILAWFSNPLTVTLLLFPLLTLVLAGILSYQLGKKVFSNKWLSVVFSIFWMGIMIPNLGPSMITVYVMLPLLALTSLHWEKTRNRVWAGVVYGLMGLQHATLFMGVSAWYAVRFVLDLGHSFIHLEKSKLKIVKKPFWSELVTQIKRYAPIFLIGIALAMLYWWAPVFVYHGKTLNPWQEYSGQGLSQLTFGFIWSNLYHTVLNFENITSTLATLLALVGVYYTFKQKKWNPTWTFWSIGLLGLMHPWITQPLLGTSFGYYRFGVFLTIPALLFPFYGAEYLLNRFSKQKLATYGIFLVLLLFIYLRTYTVYHSFSQDATTQIGKEQSPYLQTLLQFGSWAAQNTDPGKATLTSHDETAFAYHSITGNKVVSLRRTHANPYANQNQRDADAAVMLYGKNLLKVNELLQQYHVAYLFEDAQSVQNRALCAGLWQNFTQGQYLETTYSCLQTSPEYGDYLKENGVETQKIHTRLDVSDSNAPQFDMLLVRPKNFESFNLTPLQAATVEGKTIAVLFTVKPHN